MKTHERILGVAAAVAITLPLAACVGGADPLPSVVVDVIAAPASMAATEPVIWRGGELLAASGDLPFAFGGSITEPGGVSAPAVWVSNDAASWERALIDPELDGSFIGSFAGSTERAALGGVTWKDRSYTSVLWTSDNRVNWQPIPLPEPFLSTHHLSLIDVIGTHVYGIGVSPQGETAGFIAAEGGTSTLNLPALREGEQLSPLALTGNDSTLLLIATPGPEGEYSPVVSFTSADQGASWSGPVELAASTTDFSGVVWTGSEYVATGSTPGSSAGGAAYRATSWVSTDGSTWAREAIPAPPDSSYFYLLDVADAWFGAPSVAEGVVTVIASNANSAVSALYTRSASGAWSFDGVTSVNDANGELGMAVAHGAESGADTTAVAVIGSAGHLRAGTFTGSRYSDSATLAKRDRVGYVYSAYPGDDGVDLVVRQRDFTVQENLSWRNTSSYTLAAYAGGESVSSTPWDPEAVGELLTIAMATDATGAQIVTGSRFPADQSAIFAEGYHRANDTAQWTPMTGFSREGSTEFNALVSTADGWVAVGDYRVTSNTGTPTHATVWQSTDGIAWSQAGGDFGDGRLETSLADACVLPDGTPIGIGWVEVNTGAYRMAAWSPDGDNWSRQDLGEFGDRDGYATSCANDESGVIVSATVAGRSVLLRTTTGSDWRQVFRAEQGVTMLDPVAVDGGFAAAGGWADGTTAGAVVWLSRNGTQWAPVSIPSRNPDSTYLVAPVGGDLLVALAASSGDPLVVVRDIAQVIERLAPASD